MMNEIAGLVSSLGFPIACVVALAFYIYKVENAQTAQMQALQKTVENLEKSVDSLNDLVKKLFSKFDIKVVKKDGDSEL